MYLYAVYFIVVPATDKNFCGFRLKATSSNQNSKQLKTFF